MPRATCRCGQPLDLPRDGAERIVCPQCGAKIRVRRSPTGGPSGDEDGFIRFSCPCGRRLKVMAADGGRAGLAQCRCPDCGRVVNVPERSSTSDPETPTTELSAADLAMLREWSGKFGESPAEPPPPSTVDFPSTPGVSAWRAEAGMRVCPKCGKPIHLGAEQCRACGVAVPRR